MPGHKRDTNATQQIVSPEEMKNLFFGVLSRTQMRHKYIQVTIWSKQNTRECDVDTFVWRKCCYLVYWSCYLVCFDRQHTAFFLTNHHRYHQRSDALLLFGTCRLFKFQVFLVPLNSLCVCYRNFCNPNHNVDCIASLPHSFLPYGFSNQRQCILGMRVKTIFIIPFSFTTMATVQNAETAFAFSSVVTIIAVDTTCN